jgi:hypothetical protein
MLLPVRALLWVSLCPALRAQDRVMAGPYPNKKMNCMIEYICILYNKFLKYL